jgi:lysophospholipase L1-like esterase
MRFPLAWFLAVPLLLGLAAPPAARAAEPAAAAVACPDAAAQHLSLPASRAALRAGRPLTIIAFGSSSTEGSGASGPDRTYPAQLEKLLRAALPGRALRVLNRGIGGQEVKEMLARLQGDVIDWHPTLVIWQAGANAVLKGMDPQEFRAALAGGLARLHASGADVVLMDSQRAPRILASPRHPIFDAALQDLAETQHLPLFSRAALMRDWAEAGVPNEAMLHPDGLHHNDRGYRCVAAALAGSILRAIGSAPVMAGRQ